MLAPVSLGPTISLLLPSPVAGSNFYNPNPAYPSGSTHQQPSHQPPGGQQHQQQWNPMQGLAGSMGVNDATAQMGLQFGSQAFSAGQNYMNQTVRCPFFLWFGVGREEGGGHVFVRSAFKTNPRPSSFLPTLIRTRSPLRFPIDPLNLTCCRTHYSPFRAPQFTKHLPMPLLKHAFQVSNSYVLRKLVVLLWPWRHRQWARTVRRNNEGQGEGWASPREDLNAPDLYIPSASFSPLLIFSLSRFGG